MVSDCVFSMTKRYILTRLMSQLGTRRESLSGDVQTLYLSLTSLLPKCGHPVDQSAAGVHVYFCCVCDRPLSLGIYTHLKMNLALRTLIGFHALTCHANKQCTSLPCCLHAAGRMFLPQRVQSTIGSYATLDEGDLPTSCVPFCWAPVPQRGHQAA